MALSCENTFKNFRLDSGDPAKFNEKPISETQDDIATKVEELKEKPCEFFVEKEIKPYIVDVTAEQISCEKVEISIPESTLPVSGEISNVENVLPSEKYSVKSSDVIPATLSGQDLLKESDANKTEKIIKRVHFNSEVEIFTFVPHLRTMENYNFMEDVSLENSSVSIDVNDAGDSHWSMKHLYWNEQSCKTSIEKEIKPNAVDEITKQNSYEKIDTRIPESNSCVTVSSESSFSPEHLYWNKQSCETSIENEIKPNAVDEITKQNSYEKIDTSIPDSKSCVTVSSESFDVENVLPAENYNVKPSIIISTTITGKDLSKKSGENKTEKIIKRVHFNSEVENFIFVPGLSIMENYNLVEDVTPNNSFASIDVNNTVNSHWRMQHLYWKSESNLSISSSCSQRPTLRKRFRHNLRVSKMYSRLNDESIDDATDWMPRSRSVYYPKKAIENFTNGDENKTSSTKSWNLSRRLSKSVENLKKNTKAFMNKVLTKVKKRKEETYPLYDIPEERAGSIAEVADKDVKERTEKKEKLERRNSIFSWKKKDEDGSKSASAMPENLCEQLSKLEGNSKADSSKSFMDRCKKFVKKK